MNKEKSYINVLKGIGALLVVISHAPKTNFISSIVVPCFLALFFWVSGYTYNYKKKYIYDSFIKTIKLMLELGTFEIIMRQLLSILVYNSTFDLKQIIDGYIGLFISVANHPRYFDYLWFFPCIFTTKIVFHISHLINNKKISFVISIILSGIGFFVWVYTQNPVDYLWHLPIALLMQIVLELGYLCKLYDNSKKESPLGGIFTIFIPILTIIFFLMLLKFPIDADLHTGMFTNGYRYCMYMLIELPVIIFIAKRIEKNKLLEYMGKNSAYFFSYQVIYIELFKAVISSFPDDMNIFLKMITIVPLTCLLIYFTIEGRKEIICMIRKLNNCKNLTEVIK